VDGSPKIKITEEKKPFKSFSVSTTLNYYVNGGICEGPYNAKNLMLLVKSVLHYFKYYLSVKECKQIHFWIFSFRIINICILVSLFSCALGYQHQVQAYSWHLQCNFKFTTLINSKFLLTFYHMSWSLTIISYRVLYRIVMWGYRYTPSGKLATDIYMHFNESILLYCYKDHPTDLHLKLRISSSKNQICTKLHIFAQFGVFFLISV